MIIEPIKVKDVTKQWRFIKPYIVRASGDIESLTKIKKRLAAGNLFAAILTDDNQVIGAVVFELSDESLHIISLCADDLPKQWHYSFLSQWKQLAGLFNKPKLTLNGRKGWQRLLKPLGFTVDSNGYLGVSI